MLHIHPRFYWFCWSRVEFYSVAYNEYDMLMFDQCRSTHLWILLVCLLIFLKRLDINNAPVLKYAIFSILYSYKIFMHVEMIFREYVFLTPTLINLGNYFNKLNSTLTLTQQGRDSFIVAMSTFHGFRTTLAIVNKNYWMKKN